MKPQEIADTINAGRAERGEPPINARVVDGEVVSDPVRATPTAMELNNLAPLHSKALAQSAAKSLAENGGKRRKKSRQTGKSKAQRETIFAFLRERPGGATAGEIHAALDIATLPAVVMLLTGMQRMGLTQFRKAVRTAKGPRGGEGMLCVWSLKDGASMS